MYGDLDINLNSDIITLFKSNSDGVNEIVIQNFKTKEDIAKIDPKYVPQGPRLSPDGRQIAFFGDAHLYIHDIKQKLTYVLLDDPDLHAGFCEWSYDGKQLVFSAYGKKENRKFPPNIYYMNVDAGQPKQISFDKSVDRFPQWSPFSKYVAYVKQNLDEPHMPGWVCLVDMKSRDTHVLPKESEISYRLGRYCFSQNSSYILVTASRNGDSFLRVIRLEDLSVIRDFYEENLVGGAFWGADCIISISKKCISLISVETGQIIDRLSLDSMSGIKSNLLGPSITLQYEKNSLFFIGENSHIYNWEPGRDCKKIFEATKEQLPFFETEEYRIPSLDGRSVPVHRYIPLKAKEIGVLFVFGGPGGEINPNDPIVQRLIREGYEVIAPSYRGSSGYGEEHRNANKREYGRGDVWDVLACGLDWKRKTRNKRPLAIVGFSYGGYLTFLAMAREKTPWDCGATLWGVTKIEYLVLHVRRAYPDEPVEKAKAVIERSPIEQAHRIHNPLLILHGARDTTSTNEEVRSIFQKVNSNGTNCDDNDTHGLPKNRKEMFRLLLEFLEKMNSRRNDY